MAFKNALALVWMDAVLAKPKNHSLVINRYRGNYHHGANGLLAQSNAVVVSKIELEPASIVAVLVNFLNHKLVMNRTAVSNLAFGTYSETVHVNKLAWKSPLILENFGKIFWKIRSWRKTLSL